MIATRFSHGSLDMRISVGMEPFGFGGAQAPHKFSFACSSVERRCGRPVRPESWRRHLRHGPERTVRPNLSFRLTEVRPRKRRALRRGTLKLEIGCSLGFLKLGRRSFSPWRACQAPVESQKR